MSHPDVLICTLEPIRQQMAGPAIRAVELGKQLAREMQVCVYSPQATDLTEPLPAPPGFSLVTGAGKSEFYQLAQKARTFFIQANVLKPYPRLAQMGKPLAVDLYDPYLLSVLAQYAGDHLTQASSYSLMHKVLEQHLIACDFSVCASERQRDYWLGRYCSLGRLTPKLFELDPSFRNLIDVVPFGLPGETPLRTGPGVKGVVPGIGHNDFLLVWGGGIWEWFDPLTVIAAVKTLAPRFPKLKLYFMGFKSPNPQVDLMNMSVRAYELAKELGLLNKHVFFNETWTPYQERINVLLDADAAVSAHFDLLETRFSFRTRILDYLWAGKPVLTTCGDQLADWIAAAPAGFALPYKNADAWTQAIEKLISNAELPQTLSSGARNLAQRFAWSTVAEPLANFCRNPHRLPEFKRIKMPTVVERARAVYSRGGKELILRRSRELVKDILS